MAGFRLASREATKYIKQQLAVKSETLGREVLVNAARTSMSSKVIGAQSDFYAELAVKAALRVQQTTSKGKISCPIASINVLKAHGKSAKESEFIEGYALNCTLGSQQMPRTIRSAKIALLDFGLQKAKMDMGVQVVVDRPEVIFNQFFIFFIFFEFCAFFSFQFFIFW